MAPSCSYYSLLTLSSSPLFLTPPPRLALLSVKPPSSPPPPPPLAASSSYNGWADLAAAAASSSSSSTLNTFLFPLLPGEENGRYGLPHLLLLLLLLAGSLALPRVRVPPLALLPASALLFAAGFAAAAASEEEKMRDFGSVLADLDGKVGILRDELVRSESGNVGDLVEVVDCVKIRLGDARKLVEGNCKSTSKRPVVIGDVVSDLGKYLGGLIQENLAELSSPRKKAASNKEKLADNVAAGEKISSVVGSAANVHADEKDKVKDGKEMPVVPGIRDSIDEKKFLNSRDGMLSYDEEIDGVGSANVHANATDKMKDGKEMPVVPGIRDGIDEKKFLNSMYDKEIDDLDARFHVRSEQGRLERLVFKHKYGRRGMRDVMVDPFEDGSGSRMMDGRKENMGFVSESKESSLLERTLEIRDRSYKLKIEHMGDNELSGARVRPEDAFVDNAASFDSMEDGSILSSAATSDGEEFDHNIKEATEILRKARECMMNKTDEETADALLYKSARLFSTAVALKPTSLLAVGHLGNTYLLHGELKLKISRELRTLLSHSDAYLSGKERGLRLRKLDKKILSRENITSALVDVCEECESLLVEAGRSYRMALSIDSGDIKALYNWGLALIFRAQLIADIGPEAAVDADKVYLAAIDKFDAMLSKSNAYAPEALYRWGIALQQRSHLRPRNNREKIRLLEQAKSMFEDVLYVEADNKFVREALSSCISELNYHGRWL